MAITTFMDHIDWPKFSSLVIAKIGALRLAAEKFPEGPAKVKYVQDTFAPVFALLAEFTECTGGVEEWNKVSDEQKAMLAAHATAPLGTTFPAEISVTLHDDLNRRIGEG
jgi:hypothetical protein